MAVVLIKGDDSTLVSQALSATISDLLDGGDRSLMTEELTEQEYMGSGSTPEIGPLVTALGTPPFLTDRRIVIGRNMAVFSKAAQVAPLVDVLTSLLEQIDVVLVWEKGSSSNRLASLPKPLKEVLKTVGAQTLEVAPSGRGRKKLLDERLDMAPVRLETRAKKAIAAQIGDDIGRLNSMFDTLVSTFGEGSTVGADDVAPFLGTASDIPPWDLTDAIDTGNIALALSNVSRMFVGGERHSLQVMSILTNHYQRAWALDGSGVTDEKSAAAILGMKGSTFPAKKAMQLSRRLGSTRLRRILSLLADADLDLRGRTAVPPEMVVEVLVARLAHLSS